MFLFDEKGLMPPEGSYLVLPRKIDYKVIYLDTKSTGFPVFIYHEVHQLKWLERQSNSVVYAKYGEY